MSNEYPDDFSNYPVSVAERISGKERNASKWSPRDALIDALRDLDSGKIKADALVIVHTEMLADGGTSTKWSASSPNILVTLGLLDYAKARMMSKAYDN